MLGVFQNRAGARLPAARRRTLERAKAKDELRKLHGRPARPTSRAPAGRRAR